MSAPLSLEHRLVELCVERDRGWTRRCNGLGSWRGLRGYFAAVSRLGDGIAWYALMVVLILTEGTRGTYAAAHMAVTSLVSLLLYKGLKRWTRRPRPFAADVRVRAWIAPLDEFSFPSGHTLHAVTFTLIAIAWFPWLAWILLPFAASVALSRVVLGLHYPSDVLAASIIGTALASLSLWAVPGATLFH